VHHGRHVVVYKTLLSLLRPSSDDTLSSVCLLRSPSSSALPVFFFGLHHRILRRASRTRRSATAHTRADTSFFQELAFDPSSTLTAHLSLEISRGHSTVCTPLHGMYSTLVPNHFQSNAVCTSPGHAPSVAQPCQATYAYAKHSQLWP
jgi:hypothetical protein